MKSPEDLNKMMAEWRKYARDKFEHLDLDGNMQADYNEHHQPSRWKKFLGRS